MNCSLAREIMENEVEHPIKRACKRLDLSPHMEGAYLAVYDRCKEWYRPTNNADKTHGLDEYSYAQTMHHLGLLDERRISVWRDGQYRGKRVEFRQAEALLPANST